MKEIAVAAMMVIFRMNVRDDNRTIRYILICTNIIYNKYNFVSQTITVHKQRVNRTMSMGTAHIFYSDLS